MPRSKSAVAKPVAAGAVWLTTAQLKARYGNVSHMFLERLMKRDPTFPRPTTFGSSFRFWLLSELEAWERACAAKKSA